MSPTGFHIVVEVKTSDAFSIKTNTLVGYVNDLISEHQIPSWEEALGLYVLGRPDPNINQLQNAIVAEKRSDQLRIISVDSLLSLAEVVGGYDIGHDEALAVLRPSGPNVDPIVNLLTVLVAEPRPPSEPESEDEEETQSHTQSNAFWIAPVKSVPEQSAEDCISILVGEERIYAFGDKTPGRKRIVPGDQICFYITGGVGVVAHATVASLPKRKPHPRVRDSEKYPWVFKLKNTHLYLDAPTVIDSDLRARLDGFKGREPSSPWAWFVQATRRISEHDFRILIRQPS